MPSTQQKNSFNKNRIWSIGGLTVVIIGAIAFFIFKGNNSTVEPKVSTLSSSPPTPKSSPSTPIASSKPIETSASTLNRPFNSVEIQDLKPYTHKSKVFTLLTPEGWQSQDNSQPGEVIVNWTDSTRHGSLDTDIFDIDYDPTPRDLIQLLQDFLKGKFKQEPDFYLNDPQSQKDGSILLMWGYTAKTPENVEVKLLGHSFIEGQGKRIAILSLIVPSEQFSDLKQPINRIINNYKIDTVVKLP